MGFENRRSARVNVELDLYFWSEGKVTGPGTWGKALNVSETGLAFHSDEGVPPGEVILVEFHLPGLSKPLRLFSNIVHSGREDSNERRHRVRIKFIDPSADERLLLAQFILKTADPKLAAATGWGKAYFPDKPSIEIMYRELSSDEQKQWMEKRAFLSIKEVGYLRQFQGFLERSLGSKTPGSFKLLGDKPLKDHAGVWLELALPEAPLHILGDVLWCTQEKGERAQAGLTLLAFQKEEAIKLEKG